jgi:hypothetical protein
LIYYNLENLFAKDREESASRGALLKRILFIMIWLLNSHFVRAETRIETGDSQSINNPSIDEGKDVSGWVDKLTGGEACAEATPQEFANLKAALKSLHPNYIPKNLPTANPHVAEQSLYFFVSAHESKDSAQCLNNNLSALLGPHLEETQNTPAGCVSTPGNKSTRHLVYPDKEYTCLERNAIDAIASNIDKIREDEILLNGLEHTAGSKTMAWTQQYKERQKVLIELRTLRSKIWMLDNPRMADYFRELIDSGISGKDFRRMNMAPNIDPKKTQFSTSQRYNVARNGSNSDEFMRPWVNFARQSLPNSNLDFSFRRGAILQLIGQAKRSEQDLDSFFRTGKYPENLREELVAYSPLMQELATRTKFNVRNLSCRLNSTFIEGEAKIQAAEGTLGKVSTVGALALSAPLGEIDGPAILMASTVGAANSKVVLNILTAASAMGILEPIGHAIVRSCGKANEILTNRCDTFESWNQEQVRSENHGECLAQSALGALATAGVAVGAGLRVAATMRPSSAGPFDPTLGVRAVRLPPSATNASPGSVPSTTSRVAAAPKTFARSRGQRNTFSYSSTPPANDSIFTAEEGFVPPNPAIWGPPDGTSGDMGIELASVLKERGEILAEVHLNLHPPANETWEAGSNGVGSNAHDPTAHVKLGGRGLSRTFDEGSKEANNQGVLTSLKVDGVETLNPSRIQSLASRPVEGSGGVPLVFNPRTGTYVEPPAMDSGSLAKLFSPGRKELDVLGEARADLIFKSTQRLNFQDRKALSTQRAALVRGLDLMDHAPTERVARSQLAVRRFSRDSSIDAANSTRAQTDAEALRWQQAADAVDPDTGSAADLWHLSGLGLRALMEGMQSGDAEVTVTVDSGVTPYKGYSASRSPSKSVRIPNTEIYGQLNLAAARLARLRLKQIDKALSARSPASQTPP